MHIKVEKDATWKKFQLTKDYSNAAYTYPHFLKNDGFRARS